MAVTLKSRLPLIAAELRPRVSRAVKQAAQEIAEEAKQRVPDAPPLGEGLIDAIHVERDGPASYYVVAGDDDVFYGHMVEFGTSRAAPHPFLIPAAEAGREKAVALVAAVLRGL